MSGDSWENQVTVEDVVGQLTRSQVTVEDFRWPLRMSGITVEVSERSDRLRVASLTHEMPQSTFLTAHLTILGPIFYTRDFLSSFLEQSSSKWTCIPVSEAIIFQMDLLSPFQTSLLPNVDFFIFQLLPPASRKSCRRLIPLSPQLGRGKVCFWPADHATGWYRTKNIGENCCQQFWKWFPQAGTVAVVSIPWRRSSTLYSVQYSTFFAEKIR